MPNGETHLKITAALIATSAAVCVYGGYSQWHTAGVATGLLITPDLDLAENGSYAMRMLHKIPVVGSALAGLWFWYWLPYGKLIKHRSFWSHAPIISTLIRIAYILWWFWFVPDSVIYGAWVVGLCVADAGHIVADYGMTFIRWLRKLPRKIVTRIHEFYITFVTRKPS